MKENAGMKSHINFEDEVAMKGILEVKVFKAGVLIDSFIDENLIVNGARTQMANLLAGEFDDRNIAKIGLGTNGTQPTVADTELTNAYIKDISGYSFPDETSVRFDWEVEEDEDNGQEIMEFGLICEDDTLFSRRVRTKPINKEEDISIEGHWTIKF